MAIWDRLVPGRSQARATAEREFWERRGLLREDVTVFGEELTELHVDTLTSDLTGDLGETYRHALDSYERAKALLGAAETSTSLDDVDAALVGGRWQRACVLALAEGGTRPPRRAECFFNPQHGPSSATVDWTPPGGVARAVEVCAADARRLEAGDQPAYRLVRVGDRQVPMVLADLQPGYVAPVDQRSIRDKRRDLVADQALRRGHTDLPGGGGL